MKMKRGRILNYITKISCFFCLLSVLNFSCGDENSSNHTKIVIKYPNGKIKFVKNLNKSGNMDGLTSEYDSLGKNIANELYIDGKRMFSETLNKNGTLDDFSPLIDYKIDTNQFQLGDTIFVYLDIFQDSVVSGLQILQVYSDETDSLVYETKNTDAIFCLEFYPNRCGNYTIRMEGIFEFVWRDEIPKYTYHEKFNINVR